MGWGAFFGPRGRALPLLATMLAAASLAALPAAGQLPALPQAFGVQVSVAAPTEVTLEPGGSHVYLVTVTNTGQLPLGTSGADHTIRMTSSAAPQGWSGAFESGGEQFQLEPGASRQVKFTVAVQEDATEEDAVFTITATVDEPPPPGQEPASDSATVTAGVERDFFAGLTNQLGDNVILLVLAGVGAMVIILAVLATRRKGELVMHCPEPAKEVAPGSGTSYPILVENRSRSRESVSLFTTEAPPGWETFLPLAEISLSGGEQETVWLSVKAPRTARLGEQVLVKVIATPSSDADRKETVETMTTVSGHTARTGGPVRSEWDEAVLESEASVIEEEPPVAVKRPRAS